MRLTPPSAQEQPSESFTQRLIAGMPLGTAAALAAFCALPALLSLLGANFGSPPALDPSAYAGLQNPEFMDASFRSMSGSFTHTLLEWTATILAFFTVVLAFAHFAVKRDIVTPVIALALLAAGTMDAFHTLAADRLISATADNRQLIPFTWAICRTFNAVIPLSALVMLFVVRRWSPSDAPRRSLWLVGAVAAVLAVLAFATIQYCASSPNLPQTMFQDSTITRPWDVYPLVIYAFSGFLLYPLFIRRFSSYFAIALWLSVIPDVVTQLHMAFGSTALFDHHFNIAHSMKIIAYLVPCLGLVFDYVRTYRQIEVEVSVRTEAETALRIKAAALQEANRKIETKAQELNETNELLNTKAADLERSNADLEKFAYVASHDLQEPLRMVASYTGLLAEEYRGKLDEEADKYINYAVDGADRMQTLIQDLLGYSRIGTSERPFEETDSRGVIDDVLHDLQMKLQETGAKIVHSGLPKVWADPAQLRLVFQNLIANAVKFSREAPRVEVDAERADSAWRFAVRDNGIGVDMQYGDRVFEIFQRLHTRREYEGSGMGLAISKRIVLRHGGRIWVESQPGQGATFFFTVEDKPNQLPSS